MSSLKPFGRSLLLFFCTFAFVLNSSQLFARDEPLVRNYLRVKAILKEESPIYSQPSTRSDEIDRAKQDSLVFLFHPGGGTDYIRDGFYRVGKDPDEALGWIPQNVLREWDHRMCLHFTPLVGRKPALVYGSKDDAERALRENTADKKKAAAEEPGDLSNNRYSMLLPVLDDLTLTAGGEVKKAYQIGYLAGGSRFSATSIAPPKEVESSGEIAILELMFVLDTTMGMQPFIDGTRKAIESISRRAKMQEAGMRIGLIGYRDYIKDLRNQREMEQMGYVVKRFSPLTRNHREVIRLLEEEVRAAKVLSEDYPEAVFDGLYEAITETDWEQDKSSLRIVVLIGDASGHPEGHEKNPMNYSLPQLVETASRRRVRMIAIKIRSGLDIRSMLDDDPIHREQMQLLAQGTAVADSGSYHEIEITANMQEEFVRTLTAAIETEISRMGKLVDVVKDPGGTLPTLSPSESAIILSALKPSRTGSDRVEFKEGWICEQSPEGHPQVKPYVFLSFDDLALNVFYLQTALTLATTPTDAVQRRIAEIVKVQTGEAWEEGESLADHYQKRLGMPTTTRLLRFSLPELATWGEQRRKDLVEAIKGKVKLMETHRDNPESWYALGKKDFRYTFVPLDYLP